MWRMDCSGGTRGTQRDEWRSGDVTCRVLPTLLDVRVSKNMSLGVVKLYPVSRGQTKLSEEMYKKFDSKD